MTDLDHPGQPLEPTGSPVSGEPVFLAVGKLRRPHGVHGEMLMDVLTDFPERLAPGVRVFIGEDHQPFLIRSCRSQMEALLVAFQGYATPEAVGLLRNRLVCVRADEIPDLGEGEYYHHEILGMKVVDEGGALIGFITDILESAAHDIFVVQTEDKKEVLIPMTDEVVLKVDLKRREMQVRLLPGLFPEAAE
jgi:16S rRNA processing protein RimM